MKLTPEEEIEYKKKILEFVNLLLSDSGFFGPKKIDLLIDNLKSLAGTAGQINKANETLNELMTAINKAENVATDLNCTINRIRTCPHCGENLANR